MTARRSGRPTIAEELLSLERRLARRDRVEELLDDEFIETGSSGKVYDKAEALAAIAREPPDELEILEFSLRLLGPGIALVTCRAGGSLRSSIWVRRGGAWRIVFHQGTRSPP